MKELQEGWELQNKSDLEGFVSLLAKRLSRSNSGYWGWALDIPGFRHASITYGANASFIGDTNVPAVDKDSTVIINSSSGETETLKIFAKQAKEVDAELLLITQNPDSTIGLLSNFILKIP